MLTLARLAWELLALSRATCLAAAGMKLSRVDSRADPLFLSVFMSVAMSFTVTAVEAVVRVGSLWLVQAMSIVLILIFVYAGRLA